MIVDCHCHAGKGDGSDAHDPEARISAYLSRAARTGIGGTVLLAPLGPDYAAANRHVGRLVLARPDRLAGFAFVHARRDAGRVRELVAEGVERFGFCGIKAHRYDATLTREVCAAARAFRLPLLYDPVGEIGTVQRLAAEFGDVTFIVPHLGSYNDDWRAQRAVIELLLRAPNVVADTSGIRHFDVLADAVRRAGSHKLLFGTDGPWLHPALELEKIRLLGLPPSDEALILSGNARRLIPGTRRFAGTPPRPPDDGWRAPPVYSDRPPPPRPRPRPSRPRPQSQRPRPARISRGRAGAAAARRGR